MMKGAYIFFFCSIAGACFGLVAAIGFVGSPVVIIGLSYGAALGGVLGVLFSPFFVAKRNAQNIFQVIVMCFLLSFPVAVISGFTGRPEFAILLTALTVFATYLVLLRTGFNDEARLFRNKTVYIVPLLSLIGGGLLAYNYTTKFLPDDIPALIEMLGRNEEELHSAAASKLRRYGKEPLLSALKHSNPLVRARAAHLLGLLKDPTVQEVLITMTKDSDAHVRMWSAFSLGEIGNEKALPVLALLAKDQVEVVRLEAVEAIEKIKKREKPG